MQLKGNEADYVLLYAIIGLAKGPFTRLASGLMHRFDLHVKSTADRDTGGWFFEVSR